MTDLVDFEMGDWAGAVDASEEAIEQRSQAFMALVVLNILDVITTAFVLERGGTEYNPFVEPFVDNLTQISLLKLAALTIVAGLLTRCPESRVADLALVGATGWYVAVVGWNLTVLAFI